MSPLNKHLLDIALALIHLNTIDNDGFDDWIQTIFDDVEYDINVFMDNGNLWATAYPVRNGETIIDQPIYIIKGQPYEVQTD